MGRGSINDFFITPIIAQYYINDGVFLLINRKFLGKINNLQYNRAMLVDQLYEFQDDIYIHVYSDL